MAKSEQSEQSQYEQLLYDEQKYRTKLDQYADESASSWTPEKIQDAKQLAQDIRENYLKQIEFHRLGRHDQKTAYSNMEMQEHNQSTTKTAIYTLTSVGLVFMFIYGLINYRNAEDDDDDKNLYLALWLVPTVSFGLTIIILLCGCTCLLCRLTANDN